MVIITIIILIVIVILRMAKQYGKKQPKDSTRDRRKMVCAQVTVCSTTTKEANIKVTGLTI